MITEATTSAEVRAEIEAAYRRLRPGLSWTFMTSPETNMRSADVALVGLNPGGGGEEADYSTMWDSPEGNDYLIGDWKLGHGPGGAPLQIQVQRLCALAGTTADDLFSAQFVPFRSPDWARLRPKEEALAFARQLWCWVLANSRFGICFTLGHLTGAELAGLAGATELLSVPVGWGKQRLRRYRTVEGRRIVSLPHLSRYRLFSGTAAAERATILRGALDF